MLDVRSQAALAFVIALTFAHAGCGRSPELNEDERADAVDETVTIVQAEVPKRYVAPLPSDVASLHAWLTGDSSLTVVAHVVDSILLGDPDMLARLREASSQVRDAEAAQWASKWAELFEYGRVSPSFCTQARSIMDAPPSAIRAALSLPFSGSCAEAADVSLIVRADTPNSAVLTFFDPWRQYGMAERIGFHPRLASAARETIANASEMEARRAAFVLAGQRDPRAEAALVDIHSAIKAQEKADRVAMAFLRSESADVRARAAGACKRSPNDPMCESHQRMEEEGDLTQEEQVPPDVVRARIDQLTALGFDKAASLDVSKMDSDATEFLLVAARHAYWFDVETGMYPNQHDSLMRQLSSLIAPELDAAVFEEIAPGFDDESAPYEIVAYAKGKKYRTLAENLGDWYDIDAVLRLMNTIMADRKSATRFVSLATEDQTMIIVAGPSTAIAAAAKQGLLELGDPAEAERLGKHFEDRMLKSLQ